jgi:hypothetical protein
VGEEIGEEREGVGGRGSNDVERITCCGIRLHAEEAWGARAVEHRLTNFQLQFIIFLASDNSIAFVEPD